MKSQSLNGCLTAILTVVLCTAALAQDENKQDTEARAEVIPAASEATDAPDVIRTNADPSFIFRMSNNKFIEGVPVDLTGVDIFILETRVPVPIDAIMGIRFATDGEDNASIALTNGEVYNGRITVPDVSLSVEWGEAKIKRGMLRSMVKSNDLYWQLDDTPAGSKWFLAPKRIAPAR